jgi:hypothetical protein
MAGCPWNLLDARGARVAWCGYDNDHERTGELIANDILNLVAIGEAVGELLDTARDNLLKAQAEIDRLNKVVDQACEIIDELLGDEDRPLKTRPELAAELERRSKT